MRRLSPAQWQLVAVVVTGVLALAIYRSFLERALAMQDQHLSDLRAQQERETAAASNGHVPAPAPDPVREDQPGA